VRLIEATAGSLAVDTRPRLELATSMLVALALPSQISVRPRARLRKWDQRRRHQTRQRQDDRPQGKEREEGGAPVICAMTS
jgi:hypothetical protein